MRTGRSLAWVLLAAVCGLVPVAAASAAPARRPAVATEAAPPVTNPGRPPTPAEAAAVTRAVRTSPQTDLVPADAYVVAGVRISDLRGGWAFARVEPRAMELDRAVVVLRRGPAGWSLVEIGTALVGCDVTPREVLREMRVDCPDETAGPGGTAAG
ncbi:MAG TPA: hypothetical protein VKP11_06575, partial [Frankiaceae bacterium]|nr:hypothetical protein [Frankiaceae bacterium]